MQKMQKQQIIDYGKKSQKCKREINMQLRLQFRIYLKTLLPNKEVKQQIEIDFQDIIEKDAEMFNMYYVDSLTRIMMDMS